MCEISWNDKNIFRNFDHEVISLDHMYTLYQQHLLCDVEIVLNNERYKAHSIVLSAVSEYFNVEFTGKSETPSLKVVSINRLDNEAVQRAIDYCYTGEIEFTPDTVLKVLAAVGLFQLEPVVNACCELMSDTITSKNCFDYEETAKMYGCSPLHEKVTNYILQNYIKVSKTSEFLNISYERLQNYLNMNLNVSSERDIFNSVKAWILHDVSNRKKRLISLLKLVKLPSLTIQVLFDEVQSLCEDVPNCQQIILKALEWKLSPNKNLDTDLKWNKPRTLTSTIIAAGSLFAETAPTVEIYNPNNNTWSEYVNTNLTRINASYVLIGEELIAIGGRDGKDLDTVVSVNLKTGKKVSLPPLLEGRSAAVAAAIGDVIYVFGGYNGTTLDSVERFDPVTKTWTFLTPMITGRNGCGVAVLDDEIYVIGGWNERFSTDGIGLRTVEAFCPISGSWRTSTSLLEPRHWTTAAVIEDKIYVMGGRLKADWHSLKYKSVECYNQKTEKWSFIADMISPRYGMAGGALGNDLVIIGGAYNEGNTNVEKYDANLNKWTLLAPMHGMRENTHLFSVPISWLDRKITLN